MTLCAYPHCNNPLDDVKPGARYCSRRCQIDGYRRSYSRRTYVTLTIGEHQQLADLAETEGTTIDEIAAELIREGLGR